MVNLIYFDFINLMYWQNKEFFYKDYKKLKIGYSTYTRSVGRGYGRILLRGRGGGVKRKVRLVLFNYFCTNILGIVERVERCMQFSGYLMLVRLQNNLCFYKLAPAGIRVGTILDFSGLGRRVIGQEFFLYDLPAGCEVFNVELRAMAGGCVARAAGVCARIVSKDFVRGVALLVFRSGDYRELSLWSRATLGVVSNGGHWLKRIRSAGCARLLGWRPVSRGVAQNAVDHPHGGGRGKSVGRGVTPWGRCTKGVPTSRSRFRKIRV